MIINISIATAFLLIIIISLLITKTRISQRKKEIENYKQKLHNEEIKHNDLIVLEKQKYRELNLEKEKLQNKIDNLGCIICGKPSNAKHFCFSCYSKYNSRSIDLRVSNCSDVKILDYYGNKSEVCEDGRLVRSRAEQCIANYFYNNKIRYAYEKPIYFESKILKPDFYLPDYDLYIEYNELKDEEYIKKKDFAMQIYKRQNIKVIIMTKEDRENLYEYFCRLLHS